MLMVELIKVYLALIPTLLTSTLTWFIEGPPCRSWNFFTFLFVKILNYILLRRYSDIKNWRDLLNKLGETDCKSSIVEKADIHSKFRMLSFGLVSNLLKKTYGDDCWYSEECKWESSPALQVEWIIPKGIKLSQKSNVILFFHSGAFAFGDFSKYRAYMENVAIKTNSLVLGVNYRLAPEYSAPCQLEDALASILYLTSTIDESNPSEGGMGLSLDRVVLMGDSAGGGICASLYHFMRDAQLGKPAGAVLYSPWIDLSSSHPSHYECAATDFLPPPVNLIHDGGDFVGIKPGQLKLIYDGSTADIKSKILERGHYLSPIKYLNSPIISPIHDTNFSNLPPILIIAGEAEVLRDESILYHDAVNNSYTESQLEKFKVPPLTLHLYPDMVHIFPMNFPFLKDSKEATQKAINFINNCFSKINKYY